MHPGKMAATVTIPNRKFFRSSEVCAIAGVQPYVLRSWETEFPSLDGSRTKSGARVYERSQVELVLRIKELVFSEALTLGAARRRLAAEQPPPASEAAPPEAAAGDLFDDGIRWRLAEVEQDLRAVLKMLESRPGESDTGESSAAGGE